MFFARRLYHQHAIFPVRVIRATCQCVVPVQCRRMFVVMVGAFAARFARFGVRILLSCYVCHVLTDKTSWRCAANHTPKQTAQRPTTRQTNNLFTLILRMLVRLLQMCFLSPFLPKSFPLSVSDSWTRRPFRWIPLAK